MPKVNVDLTGEMGLAPTFAGDLNDTTATPQLRYVGTQGSFADGIFDPLRVQGYMSPANNTYTALTGTITDPIISSVYSASADTTYLAEDGIKLATVSTLSGTAVTETTFFTDDSFFKDLAIYEINDFESLFYLWTQDTPATSTVTNINLGYKAVNSSKGAFEIAAEVFGTLDADETGVESMSAATNAGLGQKFTTADFFDVIGYGVSGVRLRLENPFYPITPTYTLQVGIQTDSGGFPSGSFVAGASVTVAASSVLPGGAFDYVYFDFGVVVNLTASTVYHIVVQTTAPIPVGSQSMYWLTSANNNTLYSNGQTERYNGATWSRASLTNESFDFAIVLNRYDYLGYTSETISGDAEFVTVGETSSSVTASGVSRSWSHTTNGSPNSCITVGVQIGSGSDLVTVMTCDGNAMTLQRKDLNTGSGLAGYSYVYTITGIGAGSHTMQLNVSGGAIALTALAVSYYGVDQTTPMQYCVATHITGGAGSASVNVTGATLAGWMPFSFAHTDNGGGSSAISAGTGTTLEIQNASDTRTGIFDAGTAQTSTATYVLRYTDNATAKYFICYGPMKPAATASIVERTPTIIQQDVEGFLHPAQNGFLYIFTGNRVHKFDGGSTGGLSGTLTADVLTFPSYFKALDAVDSNSLVYIPIETSTTAEPDSRWFDADQIGVYSWDYQSILSTIRNYYPAPGARSLKRIFLDSEGDVRLITINEDGFTEIRSLTSGKFTIDYTLGLNSYPLTRDAFSYVNSMCTWLGKDGITYMLGKIRPDSKEALYKVGTVNGLAVGTMTMGVFQVGNALANQSRDGVLISYHDSTAGNKLVRWYPHGVGTISTVAQLASAGNVYTLVIQMPTLAKINYMRFYHAPVGTASTTVRGTITTYTNQSTTPARTDNVTAKDVKTGYMYVKLGQALQANLFAVQFKLSWPTTGAMSTSTDWMPRMLEIDYEPTTKLF